MDIEYKFPREFNWIGQTDIWPARDENWSQSKNDLFVKYRNWSQALAYQLYAIYRVDGMESDDYINYATIGLLESIDRFDPRYGISFKFFAKKRIRGGILNNIVKFSEKAQSTYWHNKLIKERLASIQVSNNTNSASTLIDTILDLALGFILEEEVNSTPISVFGDVDFNSVEVAALHSQLKDQIEGLPEINRIIMNEHYIGAKKFSEISKHLNLSAGRVSQIHADSIKLLRKKIRW